MATNNATNTSNPITVGQGGTGLSTATTAYGVVCSGTTATGNLQVLNSLGSSTQVLTSNGPGALPTWQAAAGGGGGNCTTSVSQTGHGLSVGQLVKCTGTDTYAVAQADTAADAEVVGIVSAVAGANAFTLLTAGVITTLTSLTSGTVYFLDPAVAGGYTATQPTAVGQINKPVMIAIDTTSANFVNMRGEIIPGPVAASTVQGANMIMNGDFQITQRTAGGFNTGGATWAVAASTTQYVFDRWQVLTNATQATTVNQQNSTSWVWRARIQRNSGQTGTGTYKFGTSLFADMAAGCQSQILTLQFLASCGANFSPTSNNITVTVSYGTGAANISNISSTFTGNTAILTQTQAITTTETLYSFQTTAPSASATQLSVVFSWAPTGTAGTNDWLQLGNVQLEIGSTANLFQRLPFSSVLEQCQLYYYKNIDYTIAPAQGAGNQLCDRFESSTTALSTLHQGYKYGRNIYKGGGTLTLYNPVNANAQLYNYGTSADCSSTSAGGGKDNVGFLLNSTTDAGAVVSSSYYGIIYQIDADVT